MQGPLRKPVRQILKPTSLGRKSVMNSSFIHIIARMLMSTLVMAIACSAFAEEIIQFETAEAFGVRNRSVHRYVSDWDRAFLSTTSGVVEAVAVTDANHGFSGHLSDSCHTLMLRLDTQSNRVYSKFKHQFILPLSKKDRAFDCRNFGIIIERLLRKGSRHAPAKIAVHTEGDQTRSIQIMFEGQTFIFPGSSKLPTSWIRNARFAE